MPENTPSPDDLADIGEGYDLEIPEEISRLHEPATPDTFDRTVPQDRTDLLMQSHAQVNQPIDHRVLGDAVLFRCTRLPCRGSDFRLLVGRREILCCAQCAGFAWHIWASSQDNHIQLECADPHCRSKFPSLEMTPTPDGRRTRPQHIQFVCFNPDCGAAWPVLEITPPQMNDRIARNHGLYIPDRFNLPGRRN